MMAIGSPMIANGIIRSRQSRNLYSYLPINLASAIAVIHFANSAGWRLMGPNVIHEYEPLTLCAKRGVMRRTTIMMAYSK